MGLVLVLMAHGGRVSLMYCCPASSPPALSEAMADGKSSEHRDARI